MTTTDLIIVDSVSPLVPPLPPSFRALFDTSTLSDAELIDFQIMASEYTGGETTNVKKYYSRTIANDGEKVDKVIWLWGFYAYPKSRTDEVTGEVQNKVGVVFQVGTEEGPEGVYLSFESIAATRFVERSLFPLIQRGIVGIGDWPIGLPMQVWEVPLDRGHTFRFKLLRAAR